MAAARASFPRPSALWLARVLTEIALLVVIALGLSGAVLGRLLPALGHQVFVIGGPSMEPTIRLGSAVILDRVPAADLAVDDVVSLRPGSGRAVFTHRIVRIVERDGGPWLETKGDNNAHSDPAIVPASAVVGRVAVVLPAAGYLMMLLSIPAGVALVLSLGATIMVLGWYLDGLDGPAPRLVERADRRQSPRAATPARSTPARSTPARSTLATRRTALGFTGASGGGGWPVGLVLALPAAAASRPVMQLHAFALPSMPWPRHGVGPARSTAPDPAPLAAPAIHPVHAAEALRLALAMPASVASRPVLRLMSLAPASNLPAGEAPATITSTASEAPIEATADVTPPASPKRSPKPRTPRPRGAADRPTGPAADPTRRSRRTARAAS